MNSAKIHPTTKKGEPTGPMPYGLRSAADAVNPGRQTHRRAPTGTMPHRLRMAADAVTHTHMNNVHATGRKSLKYKRSKRTRRYYRTARSKRSRK